MAGLPWRFHGETFLDRLWSHRLEMLELAPSTMLTP
jgi:hypothetical protein